jgi:hypothetical protein
MNPLLRRPPIAAGVLLFALFGIVDVLSPWIFPAPASAPPIADTITLVAGVLALVVLGIWLATGARAAMWVGVVIRVIGGAFSIMAFTDPTVSSGFVIANVVYLVLTVVAIVLVAPTLRARTTAPAVAA